MSVLALHAPVHARLSPFPPLGRLPGRLPVLQVLQQPPKPLPKPALTQATYFSYFSREWFQSTSSKESILQNLRFRTCHIKGLLLVPSFAFFFPRISAKIFLFLSTSNGSRSKINAKIRIISVFLNPDLHCVHCWWAKSKWEPCGHHLKLTRRVEKMHSSDRKSVVIETGGEKSSVSLVSLIFFCFKTSRS